MRSILLFILLLLLPAAAHPLDLPQLRGRVNDYAQMLSPQGKDAVERELAALERSDSTQVVVLTVPTLEGDSLEDFSIRVAEAWRIGQKGLDNGAILLVAKAERKIRIEVGRGLEGKLTDLVSGRIIRDRMAPSFKAGDFDGGVLAGVEAIAQVVKGEYQAKGQALRHARKSAPPIYAFLIFLMVAVVFLGSISRILGGLAGGAGLPLVAWFLYPGLSLIFLGGLVVAGFVLGILVTILFGSGGFGGPFFGGWYGGGGGWGGSSGGDGGFSGGGGDFGGGGSSGEW